MFKRILCCVMLLVVAAAHPAVTIAENRAAALSTAKEIINLWGKSKGTADISAQMDTLRQNDPRLADTLAYILDYWQMLNTEQTIHFDSLPEGIDHPENKCIVVLGYGLNADGSMKKELIGRLQVALTCAEQYPEMMVLCTGGGTASSNKSVTEAGAMGDWLIRHGLPRSRLLIEDRSTSTVGNATLSTKILRAKAPQITDVIIVSSEYHICWGSLLFEAAFALYDITSDDPCGLHVYSNAAYPCKSDVYSDTTSVMTTQLITLFERMYVK